ncbi:MULTISPECIES: 23S rRNA (guanosine(2251)-2'-O)-methyltransferase RlmB [unclassified Campylobacter]|uniref:23S rRNA (guanosine(2251)-2'-O)-methyltransferase RlmB n=1 Tax=unclassified Campylobacter TaxID=2593542 RepID=UPI0022EA02B5|nr:MULTISPECIES: 23S rRNA (guanosine(2251)-2'-O)-methyltransferase RlmB [unclassified Campylobacter]MDA3043106.1 23S rRNA (guanosine(2251)-2'-O)-methyltransferase RlmB [Campylobacter sp. JMF_09 ED2]MDA3044856.1 23S rRNA (guanosine(2251)-2'-O)-methyltransferase RlmB [Campylobacter sp. JMF_07 ED4]MDA3063892.1 23S rRNA (guanosine(2251)-2'-O)-methyltransferase RlmB [Campylobacter sp. JMF_11 EL3]MDA3075078.1 23S rRNA (guanosine(2251)-2'-O)-methyltransferase RlmB [Campylobacter sp. JMF_05 ED3]
MIIYGKQLFLHILEHHSEKFVRIMLAKECESDIFRRIARTGVKVERVDSKKAQALAHGGNHQGFLAEVGEFEFAEFASVKNDEFLVVLYGLTDVGNIGAIMRTAYALGANSVIIVANNLNIEGILRASSGAAYELNVVRLADGLSALNELKQAGFEICAASADGENFKELKFAKKRALVMGNEGFGIPAKVLKKCDKKVSIKMREGWDSLNVSAAFAILCDRILNG